MMKLFVPRELMPFICADIVPVHVVERHYVNGRPDFPRHPGVRCEHGCNCETSDKDVISALTHENHMLRQRLAVAEAAAKNLSAYSEDLEKVCAEHGIDLSEYFDCDSCASEEPTGCGVQGACKFVGIPQGAEVCSCSHCGGVCDKRPQ